MTRLMTWTLAGGLAVMLATPGLAQHGHGDPDPDAMRATAERLALSEVRIHPQDEGPDHLVEFGGIYHHELVRTPDGWRSRKLFEELVWKRGM